VIDSGAPRPGTITVAPTTFRNEGTLAVSYAETLAISATAQDWDNLGTIEVGQGTLSGNLATNQGTVSVGIGGTLAPTGAYVQTAGSTTLDGGILDPIGDVMITGGALGGNGTIAANVTSTGTILPGGVGSIGTLTINGDLTLAAGGSLEIDVDGPSADRIAVQGSVNRGGTLAVKAGSYVPPTSGIRFDLLGHQSASGSFDAVSGTTLPTHRSFTIDQTALLTSLVSRVDLPAPVVSLLDDTGSSAVDRVTSDGKLSTAMPIATLFNTGVDTVGNVAPNWATDLHYTLVTVPGGTDVVRVATDANGFPIGPWIGGTSLSAWIGPASDSVLSGHGGSYVYRTTFDLTGFDPGAVSISGVWAMDDIGDEIRINGQSQGYATWGWSGYSAFAPFSVTGGFVAGINTLEFVVSNGGGPTGLRVEMTGTGSTVEAGATVEYSIDDGVTWSGTFDAAEGNNRVLLRQIDLAGNISQPKLYEFTLDSTIPNAPVVSLLNDNGSSASDRITSDGTLSVTALERGARVEYSTDGMSWSASLKVAEGPNSVGVRQIDQAGNVSPATTFDFTFDSSIPRNHLFKDQFGTGTPDGIRAWDTIDFSGCTVPLTFTVLPDGSLSVVDSSDPAKNALVFSTYGNVVGGQNTNRFVFCPPTTFP
jgi:hypothetical protein